MNKAESIRWGRLMTVTVIAMLGMGSCSHRKADTMKTELELKHDIDLGIILDTTIPVQLSIPVKNRSDRKLTIKRVAKDCSCTSVSIDKQSLLPGETAYLRVVTNLTGKSGMFTSDIIIESDSIEKIDEILIKGQITGQIRIRPLRATLVTGDVAAPGNFTVYCDDQDGKWKYTGFNSEDGDISVSLNQKASSPTTSTYEGVINIHLDEAKKKNADYRVILVALTFVNDQLHKSLQLKYPVDIVVRKKLTVDPPQILFAHDAKDQKRTILVQGEEAAHIDSVRCVAPSVRATIRRMDERTLIVEIVFLPTLVHGDLSENLKCDLLSGGKSIASIPINIINIP